MKELQWISKLDDKSIKVLALDMFKNALESQVTKEKVKEDYKSLKAEQKKNEMVKNSLEWIKLNIVAFMDENKDIILAPTVIKTSNPMNDSIISDMDKVQTSKRRKTEHFNKIIDITDDHE